MTNSHRRPPACPRCGSNNTQTFEIAYLQSVRDSDSGYVSVSKLGKSIAPPEPRSVVGAALFTGAGLGSGAMLLLSSILSPSEGWPDLQVTLLDWRILLPSLLIALAAALIQAAANSVYNDSVWAPRYDAWRAKRLCRSCGRRFRPSKAPGTAHS